MENVKNTTRDNLIQFGKGLIDKAVNAVSPLLEPLDSLDDRVGVVENKFNEYQPLIDENNKVDLIIDNFVLYANYENLAPLTSANTTLYPIATRLKGNSISGIIFPDIKYYVFNNSVATRIDTATNSYNQNIVLEGGLREYLLNYYPNNAVLTNKFATKESVTNVDTRVDNLKASLATINSNLTTINTNLKHTIANNSTRLDALEASSGSASGSNQYTVKNVRNNSSYNCVVEVEDPLKVNVGDVLKYNNDEMIVIHRIAGTTSSSIFCQLHKYSESNDSKTLLIHITINSYDSSKSGCTGKLTSVILQKFIEEKINNKLPKKHKWYLSTNNTYKYFYITLNSPTDFSSSNLAPVNTSVLNVGDTVEIESLNTPTMGNVRHLLGTFRIDYLPKASNSNTDLIILKGTMLSIDKTKIGEMGQNPDSKLVPMTIYMAANDSVHEILEMQPDNPCAYEIQSFSDPSARPIINTTLRNAYMYKWLTFPKVGDIIYGGSDNEVYTIVQRTNQSPKVAEWIAIKKSTGAQVMLSFIANTSYSATTIAFTEI